MRVLLTEGGMGILFCAICVGGLLSFLPDGELKKGIRVLCGLLLSLALLLPLGPICKTLLSFSPPSISEGDGEAAIAQAIQIRVRAAEKGLIDYLETRYAVKSEITLTVDAGQIEHVVILRADVRLLSQPEEAKKSALLKDLSRILDCGEVVIT